MSSTRSATPDFGDSATTTRPRPRPPPPTRARARSAARPPPAASDYAPLGGRPHPHRVRGTTAPRTPRPGGLASARRSRGASLVDHVAHDAPI